MVEREKFGSWLMGKKQRWGKSSVTEEAPPLTSMNAARRGAQCSRRGNTRMPSSSGVEPRNLTSLRLGTLARNGWRFAGDAEKIFKMMTGMGGLQRRGVVEWRVVWVSRRSNCFAPRVAVL